MANGLLTAGNFGIGYNFKDYTVTASPEDSNYPASNLKEYTHPLWIWKADNEGDVNLVLNFTDISSISYIFLNNANFKHLWIEGNDTDSWSSPSFSSERDIDYDIRVNRIKCIIELSGFNYRYMRIRIDGSSIQSSPQKAQMGNIVIPSEIIIFDSNPSFPYPFKISKPTKKNKFESGGFEKIELSDLLRYAGTLNFKYYKKSKEEDHYIINRIAQDIPVIFWENTPDAVLTGYQSYIVYLEKDLSFSWVESNYEHTSYNFEEIL